MPEDPIERPTPDVTIDSTLFREVLGHFLTGVVVVTADDHDTPVGMTCQSLASLSIDPPLILFCPAKSSTTWPRIERVGRFCVNILSEEQQEICTAFSRSSDDKFLGIRYRAGALGAPVINGVLAYIECTVDAVHDGGDHHIVVGRVVDVGVGSRAHPLPYYRGRFQLT